MVCVLLEEGTGGVPSREAAPSTKAEQPRAPASCHATKLSCCAMDTSSFAHVFCVRDAPADESAWAFETQAVQY